MKERIFYILFWSFSAFGQDDEPSSERFKQHLFDALRNHSIEALHEISARNGVVERGFFDKIDDIDFSTAQEYCVQRFSAKYKSSGFQRFIVEVAFLKHEISSRSHEWIIAAMRRIDTNSPRSDDVTKLLQSVNIDKIQNQKGFLPLSHEFNFSDLPRSIDSQDPDVIEQLRDFGFDDLATFNLEPVRGTIYAISGVMIRYQDNQKVSYTFIARDLPVSDQQRKSGWQLTKISSPNYTKETTDYDVATETTRPVEEESSKTLNDSKSKSRGNDIEFVAYFHDNDYKEFKYNSPFLRIVIRGSLDFQHNYDRHTNEIIIRCENCSIDEGQLKIDKNQKKYFSVRNESEDNTAIFTISLHFPMRNIVDISRDTVRKASWIDVFPYLTW